MAAGKLPLFYQLVVATVWDHGGGGQSSELQTKSQIRCSGGGASNKSRHGSQKVLPSCLIVRR